MATFKHSVVIDRPIEEVFTYLSRTENETEWQAGLVKSRQTSPGPMGVGATGEDVRLWMGRRTKTSWECTEFRPNEMFAFKVVKPMPFNASYSFESTPHGTRVTMSAVPVGVTRVLWPLIAGAARKQYEGDFASLKRVLEARP